MAQCLVDFKTKQENYIFCYTVIRASFIGWPLVSRQSALQSACCRRSVCIKMNHRNGATLIKHYRQKIFKYATITYVQITIMFLVPHLKLIVFSSGALIMDLTSKMLPTSENFCQLPGGAASWPHQALGHRWRVSHFQGKHHT